MIDLHFSTLYKAFNLEMWNVIGRDEKGELKVKALEV